MTFHPTPTLTPIRVRYAECDAMGIAHHASYLPWFEVGRTDLIAAAGQRYRDLETAGFFLPLAGLEVQYRRPVRYDDTLRLETRLVSLSQVRAEFHYLVFNDAGQETTRASSRHAVTGRDGKITRLPQTTLALLQKALIQI